MNSEMETDFGKLKAMILLVKRLNKFRIIELFWDFFSTHRKDCEIFGNEVIPFRKSHWAFSGTDIFQHLLRIFCFVDGFCKIAFRLKLMSLGHHNNIIQSKR
jgi:hypothetical protein